MFYLSLLTPAQHVKKPKSDWKTKSDQLMAALCEGV